MTHDGQLADVDVAEVRHHFHGGHEGEFTLVALVDARAADDAQVVLAHGRVEGFAQQAVQRLATDLRAEALLDHLGRHLARTEPLDAGGTGDFAQAAGDVALQTLFRQREAQAAFQVAGGFDRSLHVDSCHRWPTPPAR